MPTLDEILQSDQTNSERVVALLKNILEEKYALEEGASLQFFNFNPLSPLAPIHLFKALEENLTITSLGLHANLSDEALEALLTTLQKNQSLKKLELISDVHPNLITKLAQLLENNQTQILKLSLCIKNPNAKDKAKILTNALAKNTTLKSLHLYGSDELVEALEGLQENKTLKKLDLSYRNNGNNISQTLTKILVQNNTLSKLNLCSSHCDIPILSKALQDNQGLSQLNLGNNQINGETLKILTDALQKNKNLTRLNLLYNNIHDSDIPALIELCTHPQLVDLNLSNNFITADGMKQLLPGLEKKQKFMALNLNSNYLMAGSFKAFAYALEKCQCVTQLNLRNNQINGQTLQTLILALKKNETLTSLNLSSNTLTDMDVPALVELCNHVPHLSALHLEDHYITSDAIQAFYACLETNQKLTTLNLSVSTNMQSLNRLTESLKKNTQLTQLYLKLNFAGGDEDLFVKNLCDSYEAIHELLKVNSTLLILDISLPPLYLLAPSDIPAVQAAYIKVQQAIKKNQSKAVTKYIQEAPLAHPLANITPVLEIIAEYAGTPSVIKTITPPNPVLAPSLLPLLPFSSKPPVIPLPISARIIKNLRNLWNKLCILINHVWNVLSNKFKATPPISPTSHNRRDKPAAVLSQKEKIERPNPKAIPHGEPPSEPSQNMKKYKSFS